jgi:hypothetical protein
MLVSAIGRTRRGELMIVSRKETKETKILKSELLRFLRCLLLNLWPANPRQFILQDPGIELLNKNGLTTSPLPSQTAFEWRFPINPNFSVFA